MQNDTLVGLKYTGRKIPFTFHNDNLIKKVMKWGVRGAVCDVPIEDAQWMVKWSPSDFQMVYKSPVDAIKLPDPDPIFSDEGVDGEPEIEVSKSEEEKVDELFEKVATKRSPGRPKKNETDSEA